MTHLASCLGLLLALALLVSTAAAADDRLVPPSLDVAALHDRWARTLFSADRVCAWPTYLVDPLARRQSGREDVRVFRSLRHALEDAQRAPAVCGPTIQLAAGRHQVGLVELTKPTILRGGPGALVIGTLVNVSAAPLWVQDVAFEDAPFPGALLVAHRDADVTLIRVQVRRARGFGLVQHGGRLETWATEIASTRRAPAGLAKRLDALLPPQAEPSGEPVERRALELVERHARAFARPDRFGEGVHSRVALLTQANAEAWVPFQWSALLLPECFGSGQLVTGPAAVELHQAVFAGNPGAGLAVRSALVAAEGVSAFSNGYGMSIVGPLEALASAACLGGFDIRASALMVAEPLSVLANNEVGMLVHDATVGLGDATLLLTQSTSGTWGDNVSAVEGAFFALSDSQSSFAVRAGVLYADSVGNLVGTASTSNRFGLAIQASSVYYDPADVDLSGNSELAVLSDGDLPIPNQPVELPPSP